MDREYEYEKHESDYESKAYLRGLLRYTVQSIDSLNKLEASSNPEHQDEFKRNVSGLAKFYFFKFEKTDVDRPEHLEADDYDGPTSLVNSPVSEVKEIFYSVMRVQEELGHTKLESMKRGRRRI